MPAEPCRDLVDMIKRMRYNRSSGMVRALLRLYPDRWATSEDMRASVSHCTISKMLAAKYIRRIGRKRLGGWYEITDRGRFFVLCRKLGLTFLGLCILAEAYAVYGCRAGAGPGPDYPVCDIMDIFDRIYSKKSIQNESSRLCSAGLAVSVPCHMLRLTSKGAEKAGMHREVMLELHGWVASVPNTLNIMAIEEPQRLGRITCNRALL